MGSTSLFLFGVILSGSNMVLTSSITTDGWVFKAAVTSF